MCDYIENPYESQDSCEESYYCDYDDYYDFNYSDDDNDEDYSDNMYYYPEINKHKKQINTSVTPYNLPTEKKMKEDGYDLNNTPMELLSFKDGQLTIEPTTYGKELESAKAYSQALREKRLREQRKRNKSSKKKKKKKKH